MQNLSRYSVAHNILWIAICVALVWIISGLLVTNNRLQQQTEQLKQQLSSIDEPECIARDVWRPGTSRTFTVESDKLNRTYIVHLPAKFAPNKSYPALIYFSGKGKGAADSERYSGYNQLPIVTVYPEPTIGIDGAQSWQSAPYASGANDVAFVGRMLDKINGQLCIERSHIYAVGVSNGGGFVGLLSCQLPDRIRAFGMIAGAYYYPSSACQPKAPAPIITIHGDSDQVVPYFGSVIRKLPDIDTWSAHRAQQYGCKNRPFIAHQQAATVTTWSDCQHGASVRSIRQLGVGHAWTPADRDIIWQFLSGY